MKKIYVICSLLIFGFNSWSQTKNEHEERVKLSELPEPAIKVINVLPKQCKRLRFYKETDGEMQSFEAKFKYKKQQYSVEFNIEGVVEDIEVTVKPKQIEKKITSEIEAYFKTHFEKAKLIKIQRQYIYNAVATPSVFVENVLTEKSTATVNYEIIAEVKSDSKRQIGEFLFNERGTFLSFITLNPNSYEHALY
jgi:hypothetical protein